MGPNRQAGADPDNRGGTPGIRLAVPEPVMCLSASYAAGRRNPSMSVTVLARTIGQIDPRHLVDD
jgi:hypothetical protein